MVGIDASKNRWYRFSFRGLPENHFTVTRDDLFMKVDFFGDGGSNPLDGVSRKIYSLIEKDRNDLAVNGNDRRGGAAVWKTYALEFHLPFPNIDHLRLSVGFRNGLESGFRDDAFYATDFSLVAIPEPAGAPRAVAGSPKEMPTGDNLIPLGGRWFYKPEAGSSRSVKPLTSM